MVRKFHNSDDPNTYIMRVIRRWMTRYKKGTPFCHTYFKIMEALSQYENGISVSVRDAERCAPKTAEALRLHQLWRLMQAGVNQGTRMSCFEEGGWSNDSPRDTADADGMWYLWRDADEAFDNIHRAYEDMYE
jgi:hypothetical protein